MVLQEKALSFDRDRDDFIERVIIPTGVSASVVSAFEEVDRAEFMHRENRQMAYTDDIILLTKECDATISQPSFVAHMIELLQLEATDRVLEIGTATGYQASLISRIAQRVDTVEINPDLVYWARSNVKRLHYPNITVHQGDGLKGIADKAPFNAIVVTAGLREVPQSLVDQLAAGGRLVAPIGDLPEDCVLSVLIKISESEISQRADMACMFVPLYSPQSGGWTKEELVLAREERIREHQTQRQERRAKLREALTIDGEQRYHDLLKFIGQPAASIVEKPLTENQILDLFGFFSDVFRQAQQSDESPAEKAPKPKPIVGKDAHEVDPGLMEGKSYA